MADLNVIYRIAADISGLQDGVKRAADSAQGLETTFNRIGAAIAGALTVGAVVNFGKALIDGADALVKLHDKTQISLGGLQRFQVAGDDAGVSIESMARGVNKVQDLLAGGDKSFLAALSKVNIDLATFKALKPEDQYIAISDALRKVQDPAERVNLAIDLMGKLGAENLPVLIRGFDDVKGSAVGMSDEAVRGLDALGDAITRVWRATKNLAGETIAMKVINSDSMKSVQALVGWYQTFTGTNEDLAKAVAKVPPPTRDMHEAFKAVNLTTAEQSRLEKELGEDLKTGNKTRADAAAATKKMTDEHEKARLKMHDLMWATRDYERVMSEVARLGRQVAIPTIEDMATAHERFGMKVAVGADAMRVLGRQMEELPDQAGPMREAVSRVTVEVNRLALSITSTVRHALSQLPGIFDDGFSGVLGRLKSIGRSLLDGIIQAILDPIMDYVSAWVGRLVSKLLSGFNINLPWLPSIPGGGIGTPVPGVGGGGSGAGAIIGGIGIGLGAIGFLADWSGGLGPNLPGVAPWTTNPDTGQPVSTLPPPLFGEPGFGEGFIPDFAMGSNGIQDFGSEGTLARLHNREGVFTEPQIAEIAGRNHSAAILAELKTQTDLLAATRQTILQIENKEVARAVIRALDTGSDGLGTQFREVLGVT